MNTLNVLVLLTVMLLGLALPFIPMLAIVELLLWAPIGIIIILTFTYLLLALANKNLNTQKAFFVFLILPVFIGAQFLSVYVVNKIQRFRSEQIIAEVEKMKSKAGKFPNEYILTGGIKYTKWKNSLNYTIEYSRGFMINERYSSENKKWESYGWND